MATTTNLGLTLVEQAQAQKEVTINQALNALDALVGNTVADKDLATPPGSPTTGIVYIVAASPTGAWSGKATQLAYFDQIWRFVVPQTGMRVWVADELSHYYFNGTGWTIISGGGGGSGDVVGPASATDNAIVRFDTTTGKLIQNSGIIIDDSNNISGIGTMDGGSHTITSSSANALAAGPNGATNPTLQVDASTASSATGLAVRARAAGSGLRLDVISSGTNEGMDIRAKGNGNFIIGGGGQFQIYAGGSAAFTGSSSQVAFTNVSRSFTANTGYAYSLIASTSLTASTEVHGVDFNLSATQQHATGALTLQRDFRLRPSTHSAVAASTITDAAGFAIDGAPIAGTNASITNSSAIYSPGNAVGAGITNSYGLNIKANTGATNNYAFRFEGSAGELMNLRSDGKCSLLATNTAGGTTGAQTINKPSGTVNFAAAATSLVVTNALCTTSSIVFAVIRSNDSTATIKNVVPGSGSFTINLGAAATAETSVGFFIIN